MAKYIGTLTSDARGKVGGIVLTRARGGTTLKSHSIPTNPRSGFQGANRSTIAASNSAWRSLTNANRTSWNLLAVQYLYTNSLAQTYSPTGQQLYAQAYYNASQFGEAVPATAPASPPSVAPITTCTIVNDGVVLNIIVFTAGVAYTGTWFVAMSFPLPPSINYAATRRRRFIGAKAGGNEITAGVAYTRTWGLIPPASSNFSLRFVPVDPTYFISGTPLVITQQGTP